MRSIIKKAASVILATALVVTGVCVDNTVTQAAVRAKKIVMNSSKVNIKVGEKFTLKVKKVTPKKANKAVTYKTSSKKVATVTKKGVITGVKQGKAKITVTSKSNKKAKAVVAVTVRAAQTAAASPTAAPATDAPATGTPTATAAGNGADVTATPAGTVAPTEKPQKTKGPSPNPTRTPGPPTAEPTMPTDMLDHPSAPYVLKFSDDEKTKTIDNQGKGEHTINKDGTVTVKITGQYGGVAFYVPSTLKECNFDTVTVKYRDSVVVGKGFGYGVWREADKKETETVPEGYDGSFMGVDKEGNPQTEFVARLNVDNPTAQGNTWYIRKLLIFHAGSEVNDTPASLVIESITFSHSAYVAPSPTPTTDFVATAVTSAAMTIDGKIGSKEEWKDAIEYDFTSFIASDESKTQSSTATARFMYDKDNMYVLVDVKDTEIDKGAGEDAAHKMDGVEVLFDEDDCRKTGDGLGNGLWTENKDAFQYRFTGIDLAGSDPVVAKITGGTAETQKRTDIVAKYTATDKGYIVEIKIPFKQKKEGGEVLAIDLIVQDCANSDRNGELYLLNTEAGKDYWNNKSADYGSIILAK